VVGRWGIGRPVSGMVNNAHELIALKKPKTGNKIFKIFFP
jgi:hypothetical protein